MTTKHQFLFTKGIWLGEGELSFTASQDKLKFYTRWVVDDEKQSTIHCEQQVEIEGMGNNVINQFDFLDISSEVFAINLTSENIGKVFGKGVIDEKTIAWEFRDQPGIEGYEVYELQENGEYRFHAEYLSSEHHRSIIKGRIWRQVEEQ